MDTVDIAGVAPIVLLESAVNVFVPRPRLTAVTFTEALFRENIPSVCVCVCVCVWTLPSGYRRPVPLAVFVADEGGDGPVVPALGGEAPDDDPVGDVGVLVRANLDGENLPYLVRHFLARCRNTKGLK